MKKLIKKYRQCGAKCVNSTSFLAAVLISLATMSILQAIRKLLPSRRSRQSARHAATSAGQPHWDVYSFPLEWHYSIHYDMLLWPALRSTLSRYRAEQSNRTTQVTIEALPDRSTNGMAGYRELLHEGTPILREALKAQVSGDGTIELVTYSPQLKA